MRTKEVGYIITGISVIIFAIIFIFNGALRTILQDSCSHGPTCSMYETLSIQTWVTVAIASIILLIGIVMIFMKEKEKIIFREKKVKSSKVDLSKLDETEKKVVRMLESENGAVFQSGLMEKLGIGKVGITRLLDKLEAKQIIERKRRGMNNIVVLKR
jgi:uncharacterized membrane protein